MKSIRMVQSGSKTIKFKERLGCTKFSMTLSDYMDKPCTSRGNQAVLVVIDHATKWVKAKACKDETAETAAKFIFESCIPLPFTLHTAKACETSDHPSHSTAVHL